MFSQHGHFTLAHSDRSLVVQNERAEVNKLLGIDSRVIGRDEVKKLCPQISISEDVTWPIQGALYHPPGGIIRHDAVAPGYAKQVGRAGIDIHQGVEVTGLDVRDGRCHGVKTNQGDISAGVVLSATAGWSSPVAKLAGLKLPITTSILQAFVTEPEAVPRQDHRLGTDAHLLLADRSRRVPDRRRGRAVSDVLEQGNVPVHRVRLPAHPRALPAAARNEDFVTGPGSAT